MQWASRIFQAYLGTSDVVDGGNDRPNKRKDFMKGREPARHHDPPHQVQCTTDDPLYPHPSAPGLDQASSSNTPWTGHTRAGGTHHDMTRM